MNLEKLTALAQSLPDTVKQNALDLLERMGEVIEGIGDRPVGWRAPTLKLIQAMSDRSKLPKGANIGDFLLGEDIVAQGTKVIVLRSWEARQYWSPDQNEAKMLCSSPDAKLGYIGQECKTCPHSVYDAEAKKVDCNKIKVFMVVTDDLSDVFLVQFAKTSFKNGGEWEGMMKKAGVAIYRRVYGLKAVASKEYKNVETIGIETYEGADRDTPKEYLEFVAELFNQVGTDRRESVEVFHKMILERKKNPELLVNNAGADSEVVLIEDGTTAEAKEEAPAAKQSPKAKQYSM